MYTNETLSVIMYFFNKFDRTEAEIIWGQSYLADHLYNKFQSFLSTYGPYGAHAMFLCNLDEENYKKVIERACALYDGRKNRK